MEAGAGYAAFDVAAGWTLANVAAGAMMVGGAASAIGAATGNQSLSKFGAIAGAVGGVANIGNSLLNSSFSGLSTAQADAMASSQLAGNSEGAANLATQASTDASSATQSAANMDLTGGSAPAAAPDAATATPSAAPPPVAANQTPGITPATGSVAQAGSTVASNTPSGAFDASSLKDTAGVPSGFGGMSDSQKMAALSSGNQSNGIINSLSDMWNNGSTVDKMNMLHVGSGIIGGVAQYLAPSPQAKAQINEANARTALMNQQLQTTAAHNAAVAAMGGGGVFAARGAPSPIAQATAATNSLPVAPQSASPYYALNNQPGSAYSINNNPLAPPGLIGGNQVPGG